MKNFCIKQKIIIFVVLIKIRKMNEQERKERQEQAFEDLKFYLFRYHELASRTPKMKKVIDAEIKDLVDKLKILSNKKA